MIFMQENLLIWQKGVVLPIVLADEENHLQVDLNRRSIELTPDRDEASPAMSAGIAALG